MKLKRKIFIITTLYTFLFSSFFLIAKEKKCKKVEVVRAVVAKGQKVEKRLNFSSKLFAKPEVIITSVKGNVTEIKVKEGDLISKGVEILVINDALSNEIKKLEAKVKEWKKKLWQREHWKVRSQQAEDNARKNIKKYQKLMEEKIKEAENYIIKSPYSGIISKLFVKVGDSVNKGTEIAEVKNFKKLFFNIEVDSQNIKLFSEGESFDVFIEGKEEKAIVDKIDGNEVTFFIDNESLKLKAGQVVEFSVVSMKRENAIVLSKSDLRNEEGRFFVYTPEFYKKKIIAKKAFLELEKYKNETFIVKNGLKAGDFIITTGGDCLFPGKKIKLLVYDREKGRFILLAKAKDLKFLSNAKVEKIVEKKAEKKETKKKKEIEKKEKTEKLQEEKKVVKKETKKEIERKVEEKKGKRSEQKEKECELLKTFELNKTLFGFEKLKKGFISSDRFKIILSGKELNIPQIVKETIKYNYEYFSFEKKKNVVVYSVVLYKKRARKVPISKKLAKQEKIKKRFGAKLLFGSFISKSNEIDFVSQSLMDKNISPSPTISNLLMFPGIGISYNFDRTKSVNLEFNISKRSHNLAGIYSEKVSDVFTSEYNLSLFDIKENYKFLRAKFNYVLWENSIVRFSANIGGGLYFGKISKEKNLKYSLKKENDTMYSYDYSETLDASTTGFMFSFGLKFGFDILDNLEVFTTMGIDYLLKSDWSGTYSYNLPKETTMEGNLYLVEYKDLKYLWVLDNDTYEALSKDSNYTVSSPNFISGRGNFRLMLGVQYKF